MSDDAEKANRDKDTYYLYVTISKPDVSTLSAGKRRYFYVTRDGQQVAARMCELLTKYFREKYQAPVINLYFDHNPRCSFGVGPIYPDDLFLFIDPAIGDIERELGVRVTNSSEPSPAYESNDPYDLHQYNWQAQKWAPKVRAEIFPTEGLEHSGWGHWEEMKLGDLVKRQKCSDQTIYNWVGGTTKPPPGVEIRRADRHGYFQIRIQDSPTDSK